MRNKYSAIKDIKLWLDNEIKVAQSEAALNDHRMNWEGNEVDTSVVIAVLKTVRENVIEAQQWEEEENG